MCLVGDIVKLRQVASGAVHYVEAQGDPKLSYLKLGTHHEKKLKVTYFQMLLHGRFLVLLILLGNVNSAAFIITSISNFGFDDWQTE